MEKLQHLKYSILECYTGESLFHACNKKDDQINEPKLSFVGMLVQEQEGYDALEESEKDEDQ
jgi:hypothetical protein